MILTWGQDKYEVCKKIRAHEATLKIVLKTKDDYIMLDEWIDHHAAIVGLENLIIFDNCSDNILVLAKYEKYKDRITIVRFEGFHNNIHQVDKFPELYEALRSSALFYTMLDTDERLVHIDSEKCRADSSILDFLQTNKSQKLIPGTWLSNVKTARNIFTVGTNLKSFKYGLSWGKPIINSTTEVKGFINHNIQSAEYLIGAEPPRNIFILHLNNLNPEQRISTNINKLVARGFAAKDETLESIIEKDTSRTTDPNIKQYVSELILLKSQIRKPGTPLEVQSGQARISPNSLLEFYSQEEKIAIFKYTKSGHSSIRVRVTQQEIIVVDEEQKILDKEINNYKGYVDSISDNTVTGWAVDSDGSPCFVSVFVNDEELLKAKSFCPRPDLVELKISRGLGGFRINIENLSIPSDAPIRIQFPNGQIIAGEIKT